MSNDAADPDVQAQLQSLRQRYQQSLPERLSGLDDLWQQLCREGWNEATARSLMLELHSLAGGAPTFGYPELGQSARAMEYQLQQWLNLGGLPQAMECDRFRGRIQALTQQAGEAAPPAPMPPLQAERTAQAESRLVYLYAESGIQDIVRLYEPLKHFGYNARLLHDLQALADAVEEERPLAIVCRSENEPASTAFTSWLEGVQTGRPSIPVIFIAQGGGFEARLRAVRLGGHAYLQPPLEISELVEQLDGLTAESEHTPYRVLLVDDDVPLARHYALVLGEAGMEVETAHEPACVMERLDAFRPDMVLMDLYLPGCTGVELAQVIRQDRSYVSMPIVFLSTDTDLERQLEALDTGGDDFLNKPIGDQYLISAVQSRARRSRILDSVVSRDSLTGLLKHTRIKELLDTEVERVRRSGSALAVAMIDLDRFKAVNDSFGHQSGDAVLKSLARLLRERLRSADSAGRYGGEEFLAILPDTDAEGARRVMDEIRQAFAGLEHESGVNDQLFQVTLSVGIAEFREDVSSEALTTAADRALYRAKEGGRNRVVLADREDMPEA